MRILAHRLNDLKAKVVQFNKKAKKWGLPLVDIEVIKTDVEERLYIDQDGCEIKYKIEVVYLDIQGEVPRIAGWSIHSKIQPSDIKGHNFVFTNTSHESDETLRYKPLFCDHCNSARLRKTGYWIQNEDGRTMMVGATCLKDFLPNVNIESLLSYMDNMSIITSGEDDEDIGGSIPMSEWMYHTKTIVIEALRSIELRGFVSKSKSEETGQSTTSSDLGMTGKSRASLFEGADLEALTKQAGECIEHLLAKKDSGDFFYNLQLSLRQDHIKMRMFAYIAAGAAIYLRDVAKQREQAAEGLNEHWGVVGARSVVKGLRLLNVRVIESDWGTSNIYRFADVDGRIFVWFLATKFGEIGQEYNMKVTIKRHDEFKGHKQTIITRCTTI